MVKQIPLFLALLVVIVGPIALRPKDRHVGSAGDRTLVIITPHFESIRYEFARGFEKHFLEKTGERVRVEYRTPGGTSEISRYVESEFIASFQNHWTRKLGRPWSGVVEDSFDDPKVNPEVPPADEMKRLGQEARRAFLESNVGCRIDLFFGGGSYDFEQQARAGRLVDCGYVAAHPELFNPDVIPQIVAGEPFWDPKGRWIGNVVSSFGICYNVDSLRRLGAEPPRQWSHLGSPRFLQQIALANPTQSSSVNKSLEMVIQQQMQKQLAEHPASEPEAIRAGWTRAMQLLMKIAANARYFTDTSTKISLDVEAGEAAAGMTIDFYGRYQSEAVRRPDGSSRLQYLPVIGGSSVGVDPIGMFRGAPNPDLAKAFIAYVLSVEGQKLWNWQAGVPGGPQRYTLRRLPILPELYAPEFREVRSDPDVNPYELAKTFTYHEAWTGKLFRPIAFIFRVMCIDPHDELAEAWRALIAADFPPEATAAFGDVTAVNYDAASGSIRDVLAGDKIKEVQLARELADRFRAQYAHVAALAKARR
jgi:ABC-type Fe3+ transport system substrate-binding protein